MRKFWVPPEAITNDQVQMTGEIFHHICDVCRMDVGHRFEVLLDDGRVFLVEMTAKQKKSAVAQIISQRKIEPPATPHIVLALSFPRLNVFESVLEKAVELGVKKIVPFVSQFSFIRSSESDIIKNKPTRWHKIIRSAQQQSGRPWALELSEVSSLKEVLVHFNRQPNALGLFCYEGDTAFSLSDILEKRELSGLNEIWLFVGSEGGFSAEEVDLFSEHELKALSLGDQVLRVETACTAIVSIIKYKAEMIKKVQ